jgi:F-type H+-transporting ATPase subunit delta
MTNHTTLARPYAQAIFEAALAAKQLQPWLASLKLATTISQDPKLLDLSQNPLVKSQILQIFTNILGEHCYPVINNLLQILLERQQLPLLKNITSLYEKLCAKLENIKTILVKTTLPLTATQKQKLVQVLEKKYQSHINLEEKIDLTLIAGITLYDQDQVIDGSVRSKIEKLRETL